MTKNQFIANSAVTFYTAWITKPPSTWGGLNEETFLEKSIKLAGELAEHLIEYGFIPWQE